MATTSKKPHSKLRAACAARTPLRGGLPRRHPHPRLHRRPAYRRLQEAADIIAEDSSLPSICGRVCPQESQCEGSCILGIKSEPVAMGKLSNASSATGNSNTAPPQPRPPSATAARSPSSAAARPGWPAQATCPKLGYEVKSSRRCTKAGAACWFTASPSSASRRSGSWPARSPRSNGWASGSRPTSSWAVP